MIDVEDEVGMKTKTGCWRWMKLLSSDGEEREKERERELGDSGKRGVILCFGQEQDRPTI